MAAQGGSPWDCSFVGVPPGRWWDRRHDDVFEGFYGFLAEHEDAFRGLESVAEVALVHSQRTQDRFASSDLARDGYITHVRGWELALFARHAQWDVLPPSGLEPEALRRYRAVILPNVACLSDEEAAALRQYVAGGGALLGTLETGCYDAGGGPRDGGALDDVFGVRAPLAPGRAPPDDASPLGKGTAYGGALPDATKSGPARRGAPAPHGARTPPASGRGAGVPSLSSWQAPSASSGQVLGPLPYAYTRLRRRNRLTAGFEGTDVIANEGLVRPVAAVEGAQVHATLVPEIFPQPPDLSYPTLWDNDAPVLVSHRFGKGRAVYFANGTDRLNVTSGHPDHQRLLENALAWALAGAPPLVETDAPEDVHVTLLRQPATGTLSVHLVNYSGARGRPATRPHLLGPIEVALGAPSLKEAPKAAELLVAGTSVEVARERGRIRLVVPSLELYEVVRLRQ
jgi:hypothetical protein